MRLKKTMIPVPQKDLYNARKEEEERGKARWSGRRGFAAPVAGRRDACFGE
jgi:hypothetical protein